VIPEDVHGVESVARRRRALHRIADLRAWFSLDDALGLTDVMTMKPDSSLDVDAELAKRGVRTVAVAYLAKIDTDEDEDGNATRKQDRALHGRLLSAVRSLSDQLSAGGTADLSSTTHVVEGFLDRMLEDQAAVVGLATIRSADERSLPSLSVMIYTAAGPADRPAR
jgi:hypothetical protein